METFYRQFWPDLIDKIECNMNHMREKTDPSLSFSDLQTQQVPDKKRTISLTKSLQAHNETLGT